MKGFFLPPYCSKSYEVAPFYKMKKVFFIFTFISINAFAEPRRAPAVLDTSCNFDIPTTISVMINGQKVEQEKSVELVQKELCKAVRDCMGSAPDERMAELKGREEAACSNKITALTTRVPAVVNDEGFDGSRNAKPDTSNKNPEVDSKPTAVKK